MTLIKIVCGYRGTIVKQRQTAYNLCTQWEHFTPLFNALRKLSF